MTERLTLVAPPCARRGARTTDATHATVAERRLHVMAADVVLRVHRPAPGVERALDQAEVALREVERTCTRFDPASPLSRANADPDAFVPVPVTVAVAVREAAAAHLATGGLFDPRVLGTLLDWGYDRTLPFDAPGPTRTVATTGRTIPAPRGLASVWRPDVVHDGAGWYVHLDGTPIDLGGIGKGLAVRWASRRLADAGAGHLVDAGGDIAVRGLAPSGTGWRIGVEDPAGGSEPILVLAVPSGAVATSSVRRRRWTSGGDVVHHLVDPRTGRPGGGGLAAVTVVGRDAATAEVWSKALFLAGADAVGDRADGHAAAWVHEDGTVGMTPELERFVLWRGTCG